MPKRAEKFCRKLRKLTVMPRKRPVKSKKLNKRRKTSWKGIKFAPRVKRVFKLVATAFFAVVISMATISFLSFYKFLRTPFAASSSLNETFTAEETSSFALSFIVLKDKDDQTSIVEGIYFLAGNAEDKKLDIYDINVASEFNLPERFGKQRIEKVYALGQLLEEGKGVYLTNKTLEKIFAKKIDRYILTDEESFAEVSRFFEISDSEDLFELSSFENAIKIPSEFENLRKNFETDLSLTDILFLANFFRGLGKETTSLSELSQEDILDDYSLDKKVREVFFDGGVAQEHKRVIVLNGAEAYKLGSFVSRFVENMGGSVVLVSNTPHVYDESFIISSDTDSETLKKIKRELGIEKVVPQASPEGEGLKAFMADITIISGIDYANSMW